MTFFTFKCAHQTLHIFLINSVIFVKTFSQAGFLIVGEPVLVGDLNALFLAYDGTID